MSTEERLWYDNAAERAVLGSCLVGVLDVVAKVEEVFGSTENPFYLPKHGFIWSAIRSLARDGITPDPVTVNQRMPRVQSNWDKREGPTLLFGLFEEASPQFNSYHARIVANYAACRTVNEVAIRVQQIAHGGDIDAVERVVEQAKLELGAIRPTGGARTEPWHDLLIGGGPFVLDIPAEIPPVWGTRHGEVLWAQGESLMIVGPPGVGKSTVAGQVVAGRLGLIQEVLGLPIAPGQGKLLYIAGDRPAQIARSLRRTLNREEWHDVVRERLIVWRGPPPHMFTSKPETLRAMALDAGADSVIIDSLKDVATGLGDDVAAGEYNRARQLLLAADVELIELHHQIKRGPNGQAPTELADVYGNQQLTGGAGSVMLLWGEAGQSPVQMSHLKQPQDPVGPWNIAHNHAAGTSEVENRQNVMSLIVNAPAGLEAQEAARLYHAVSEPTARQITAMRSKLERLANSGRLLRVVRNGVTAYIATAMDEEPPDDGDDNAWYR